MRYYLIIGLLFISQLAFGQQNSPLAAVQQKMQQLQWLTGHWQGSGWVYLASGQKQTFNQTEHIRFKLKNSVLLIEGAGVTGQDTAFQALALVSYNNFISRYTFQSYTNGYQTNAEVEVGDKSMIWRMKAGGTNIIRYAISINNKDQWYEIGERSADEGKTWQQFLEMTLNKVN